MKTTFTLLSLTIILGSCNVRNLNRNFEKRSVAGKQENNIIETETDSKSPDHQKKFMFGEEFLEHPQIIKDFFSLSPSFFDESIFKYDRNALKTVVKSNNTVVKNGWANYTVSYDNSYVLFENIDAFALIELKIIERNGTRQAFLNQIGEEDQHFSFLTFNSTEQQWEKSSAIPTPAISDFFMENTTEELEVLMEHGVSYVYISPETEEIEFSFLNDETKRKSKGKYQREADFKFMLAWDDNKFWLEKKPLRKH